MMVTFTRGETSIQLPDPRAPYAPREPLRQVITRSGGGVVRVSELGVPDEILPLRFVRLTNTQFASLKSFIADTLKYKGYPCTYTDHDGTDHTNMHYVEGLDTREQYRPGRWNVTITLMKNLGS